MKLKDKVAVITGGNSGIGFGIAQSFKDEGAVGSIVGRNQTTLNASVDELGSQFIGIQADVTKTDELSEIFSKTEDKFGKIDILVVNAGGAVGDGTLGSVVNTSEESYDKMMDVNLKSVFFTVQKALPFMNDGASIILVASIAAHKVLDGMTVYCSAKAGVVSFARSFASDLLDRKIKVNALSPGVIETPVFERMGLPSEAVSQAKENFTQMIPLGRMGQVSEMGKIAVFLASEDSSFLLGEEIAADGGTLNIT